MGYSGHGPSWTIILSNREVMSIYEHNPIVSVGLSNTNGMHILMNQTKLESSTKTSRCIQPKQRIALSNINLFKP